MKHKIFILTPLLIILLLVFGLVYLNLRLTPKMAAALSRLIEERTGMTFAVDSIAYLPFRGLQMSEVRFSYPSRGGEEPFLTARRIRVDLDIIKYLFHGQAAEDLFKGVEIHDPAVFVSGRLFQIMQKTQEPALPEKDHGSPGMEAPDAAMAGPEPGSPEDFVSRSDSGPRAAPGDTFFWDIGCRITGHQLFPDLVTVHNALVRYTDGSSEADLFRGLDIRISRESSQAPLRFEAADERTRINLTLDFTRRHAEGSVSAAGINPDRVISLFVANESFPRITGLVDIDASFISPVPGLVELQGSFQGKDISISHRVLGAEAVSGIDLIYDFNLIFDHEAPLAPPRILGKATPSNPAIIAAMQESHLRDPASAWGDVRVREGRLMVNGIVMEFLPAIRGIFPNPSVPARLDLRLHLPETGANTILRAIPRGLSGPFSTMEFAGQVSWDLDLEIPLDMIREMNWRSALSLKDFAVVSIPEDLNVYKLKRSFVHTLGESGSSRSFHIPEPRPAGRQWMVENSELTEGQISWLRNREKQGAPEPEIIRGNDEAESVRTDGSYRYAYLEDMSRWIPLAVLTCEDGDFFFHDGINWLTFRHALERNILSGDIELGASTLTMQLVKNLFLNRDRVLSRKIHEAFLVYLLEGTARVSKERILELYINLVEFGPGIIGIHEAADYYFGKGPDKISIAEAVWLASILPAPRSYFRMSLDGEIPDYWWARMKSYFDLMLERGRCSEDEYREALLQRPLFKNRERE